MKPIHFSKVLGRSKTLRLFRLALVAPAIMITINMSQAGTPSAPAPAAEEPELTNWIGFTVGGAFVSGDDQGFMRRTQTNGDFYGGIDTAQLEYELNDSTTLTLDGHALPGMEDYEINIELEKTDLGYVKAGFKQFRTWYDASGGYLEGANMELSEVGSLLDDERSIDRGEIYFETGLRMENLPEITFSYRHLYRDGDKDSTCWGDSRTNTTWSGTGTPSLAFKMMPALWDIDETTDIFELDVEHTLGNTELGAGLVYESYSLDNTHTMERWGSRTSPAPTTFGINEVNQNEKTDADMFAGNIHSVTRFNDKAWLSFAASYSNLDTDIDGGTRGFIYSPQTQPATTPQRDYSYDQMSGGSSVDQFITNLNFMWVPVQDLTVTPSLRYEHENIDTISNFRAYNGSASWLGLESLSSNTDMDSTTGALDIRYKGLDNIVLYAKGEWGNESESLHRGDNYLPGEFLDTDVDIDEQEYTVGANWYALSNLSFSLQGLYMSRDQSLDHEVGNQTNALVLTNGGSNNFRPIMMEHNSEIDDLNLRMTWRPMSNVSLVTRYDYVHTEYENRGIDEENTGTGSAIPGSLDPLNLIESGDVASHIVSQSVTWSPMERMYVQGTVSWISSETDTPEEYTGDSDNDSLVGSLTAGYAIDARTELTATYSYYQANNYVASRSYNGVPTMGYGYESEENMIALTLSRVINDNMVWNLRYGFITSNTTTTDQSGGYDDFDAHMVSTGLQVRF